MASSTSHRSSTSTDASSSWWLRLRRGWLGPLFSRRNLIAFGQTLAWTLPLTLILWVWAQEQQIESRTVPGVSVAFSVDDQRLFVRRPNRSGEDAQRVVVAMTLSGPRAALQEVARRIRDIEAGGPTLDLALDPAERVTIDLKRELADLRLLRGTGVRLTEIVPATIDLAVDAITDAPLDVAVGGPLPASEIVGDVSFDPPVLRLEGPATVVAEAIRIGVQAVAPISADSDFGQQTMEVRPRLTQNLVTQLTQRFGSPAVRRLRISPAVVEATFERKDRLLATGRLPAVPIWVDKPAAMEGLMRIELDLPSPLINNVEIRGPAETIRRLTEGDLRETVRARLPLTKEDRNLVNQPITRQLVFDLPQDVQAVNAAPEVNFTLRSVSQR